MSLLFIMETLATSSPPLESPTPSPARTVEVRVVNFGLFGAAVEAASRVLPGEPCRLICSVSGIAVELDARVVRSLLRFAASGEAFYEVGLRFEGVLGDAGRRILTFLVETGAAASGDRVAERFPFAGSGQAFLELESAEA
ncbi:MAG TPA: hypothetical protein VN783_03395 [Thermoanaerobaculia bacterium]|nr:hypothetical protein [Thermoanaerobaculia bacterium]